MDPKEKHVQKISDVAERLISHHSLEDRGRVMSVMPREQLVWSSNCMRGPNTGRKGFKVKRRTSQSVICYKHV